MSFSVFSVAKPGGGYQAFAVSRPDYFLMQSGERIQLDGIEFGRLAQETTTSHHIFMTGHLPEFLLEDGSGFLLTEIEEMPILHEE
jgi:hypothetical protein